MERKKNSGFVVRFVWLASWLGQSCCTGQSASDFFRFGNSEKGFSFKTTLLTFHFIGEYLNEGVVGVGFVGEPFVAQVHAEGAFVPVVIGEMQVGFQ
jgi:hypothetical protein